MTGTARILSTRGVNLPAPKKGKRSKYRNVRTYRDGRMFHSKREADRYVVLKALQQAGKIRNLELQPFFILEVNNVAIGNYFADFGYEERSVGDWWRVVEDVKGVRTDVYKIKKKLVKAIHGIEIREV